MKIVSAEAWTQTMRLEEPYAIAYSFADTATNVFLRLTTERGVTAFGCCGPSEDVTGETAEGVLGELRDVAIPQLLGEDALARARLLARLREALPQSPGTVHTVDLALHDALGKAAGLPISVLLGGFRERILTSITVGILPEAETVERARARVAQGFRCLKLKGGKSWEEDAARVRSVREAVGTEILLRFDANQGYTADDARRFSLAIADSRVEFLEQPTLATAFDELAEASKASRLPVMADEAMLSTADALRLAADEVCPLANVKLVKCGGIAAAREIAAIAAAGNIGLMVGCMDESALGIAAGLAVALSSRAVRYADLDGHIGLEGDPAAELLPLRDGYLFPSPEPGLGYHPR